MYTFKLEQFEGPLDLLLQMIEKEELNISEISLAKIADQFVENVVSQKSKVEKPALRCSKGQKLGDVADETVNCIDANEICDFLVIAAKLLYIKSKYLMPFLMTEEDEEEIGDLETRLKIYKEFLDASKVIEQLYMNERMSFVRDRLVMGCGAIQVMDADMNGNEQLGCRSPKPLSFRLGDYGTLDNRMFFPSKKLKKEDLKNAFEELVMRLKPSFKLDEAQFERRVTVQEKLEQIQKLILQKLEFGFSVLMESREKSEIIVNFLAVLELVKQQVVYVEQEEYFEEIIIKSIKY